MRFEDWTILTPAERFREAEWSRGRLREFGPRLNAVVAFAASAATSAGDVSGPLAGLPYVSKDMLDRAGRPSHWGGVRPSGAQPQVTAEVLKRLDEAGAVEVAVAAMTELAYEPSGYNAARGRALNPWHPDAVTGGSSSGSAALVACGAAVLGIGSDTGGSVRIPASCCGITGLKPTGGAPSDPAVMPLAPSLDTVGFMARGAAELAFVLPIVLPGARSSEPFGRAAILADCLAEATPGVRDAVRSGIEALRQTGVDVRSVEIADVLANADEDALSVMQAESARFHAGRPFEEGRLSATLLRRLAKGIEIGDDVLAGCLGRRENLVSAFSERLGGADLAVLPVMPIETPLAAETDPASPSFRPRVLYAMSRFTRFVNLLGLPALSVPCGFDARGVPVGLQMIGPAGSEARLLATAARLQSATDWHGRCPPFLSGSPQQASASR